MATREVKRGKRVSRVVITQCCQRDYLEPSDQRAPSSVFIGRSEARRVLEPLKTFVDVLSRVGEEVVVIHVLDWHRAERDDGHLAQFGVHCLENSVGAGLVFAEESVTRLGGRRLYSHLFNDFVASSTLPQTLEELGASPSSTRVSVVGCWTDVKVSFLCYDLTSRGYEVATSSALTASSSIAEHQRALFRMEMMLRVRIFHGVADLLEWTTGRSNFESTTPQHPSLVIEMCRSNDAEVPATLSDEEEQLVRLSFPHASKVALQPMSGGYSGAKVFRAAASQKSGQREFPTLLKMAPRDAIVAEHLNCISVEAALGNNAPRVLSFSDLRDWGVIKFSFAALTDTHDLSDVPTVHTFEHVYQTTTSVSKLVHIVKVLLGGILPRLYSTQEFRLWDIFGKNQYDFDGKGWAWGKGGTDDPDKVRERVEKVLPGQSGCAMFDFGFALVESVVPFLRDTVHQLKERSEGSHHLVATVHGDLNARNVLLDSNCNIFVVDFAYTITGPLLKDHMKLEADLMYVHTPLESEEDLQKAIWISRTLAAVDDLKQPLESELMLAGTKFEKLFECIRAIRAAVATQVGCHRSSLDLCWARLRYALHALTFDYLSPRNRLWALFDCGMMSANLRNRKRYTSTEYTLYEVPGSDGSLYLSYLPGRIDRHGSLDADVAVMKRKGIAQVIELSTSDENISCRCGNESRVYQEAGIATRIVHLANGRAPARVVMEQILEFAKKGRTAVVSMAGLGRAGLVCACWLKARGRMTASRAAEQLRAVRQDSRVIETEEQLEFLEHF